MSTTFIVLSHQHPEQVLRLIRTLRRGSPSCTVVVHHDDRRVALDTSGLDGVQRVRPPTPVAWGGPTQLDALLRSLRAALRTDCDWLTVLSGQDYPLRPLADIERRWRESGVEGFVERAPVVEGDEFARRYLYRYRQVRPLPGLVRRAIAAAYPRLMLRDMPYGTIVGRRAGGPGLPLRRGSDWLTLSRRAAQVVAGAAPELVRYYWRTILPTESLPHTVLHASGLPLSADTRRYTAWVPGSPHPNLLGTEDLDAMLASGADFARKFAPGAPVLDALDRVVLA